MKTLMQPAHQRSAMTDGKGGRLQKRHQIGLGQPHSLCSILILVPKNYCFPQKMNRFAIALSLPIGAALLLQANPSHALLVNVGGTDYDILNFEGSLADFQASGLSTPWFNSPVDAEAFANAFAALDPTAYNIVTGPIGDAFLGYLFYTSTSPDTFVAWNDGSGAPNFDHISFTGQYTCDLATEYDCAPTTLQWAYNNPSTVPAPLPLLGATAAFSFSRKLRRRVNAQKFTF